MKLKAVVHSDCPQELIDDLDNLREKVVKEVLEGYLHMKNPGPAEFYVQTCDKANSKDGFCEVRLSGVSRNDDRAVNDFSRARKALEKIYIDIIESHLPKSEKVQLFVVIMLDSPLPNRSSLVEDKPVWIGQGKIM